MHVQQHASAARSKTKAFLRRFSYFSALLIPWIWCASAAAITVEISPTKPALVGASVTFRAVVRDAVGEPRFRWTFNDGSPRIEYTPNLLEVSHVYMQPGNFVGQLAVQDDEGTAIVVIPQVVHYPTTPRAATSSSSIVYDQKRNRVYVVNQDNDSITAVDPVALKNVGELAVYRRPEALALTPQGKLWVVHKDDYAVAIVDPDKLVIETGFRLPYASQPAGLAMNPAANDAYITLMGLGKLLRLDATTGKVTGEVDVAPSARGVSVSHDGKTIFVSRFHSPDSGGEVIQVDATSMKVVKRIPLAVDADILDTDRAARGLPNYLFSVGITPDGRQAWVAGKKDNILRGHSRDKLPLNQDDTVRPMVGIVDLAKGEEIRTARIDLDDRSLPAHVAFSPLGNFAFITVAASNLVEIRDAYQPASVWSINSQAGVTPRASVLGPNNLLFVQGWLSRNVAVYDLTPVLVRLEKATPMKIAEIPTVAVEKLTKQVLRGKQMFHSSADPRMTAEGYLTCGTCHFEGTEDGRVYDFTDRGEGFRNTISLAGRRGTGHGRVNWSGNLDEIQDFEKQIRELFTGRGFMADDVLAMGTRQDPLGDPKAGLSEDLDALAAFAASLDHVNPSPFRNPDGTLTTDGQAGKALFAKLGCDFCHGGPDFTDSGRGRLHDVGTLGQFSGKRSGGTLTGIDTPTLLGVWETAPYLHDGSAPTLKDVLTTRNKNDLHGFVSALKAQEIDQLVAYLMQIDNELPIRRLPFEPEVPGGTGGAGQGGQGGGGVGGHTTGGMGCAYALTSSGEETSVLALLVGLLIAVRRAAACRSRSRPGRL